MNVLVPWVRLAGWTFSIAGLVAADVFFVSYAERGDWGWAMVEVVLIAINCISLAVNIWSAMVLGPPWRRY